MPTNTPKFNLIKPLKSEKYNVDQFNTNADTIDSELFNVNNRLDNLLTTPVPVGEIIAEEIIDARNGLPTLLSHFDFIKNYEAQQRVRTNNIYNKVDLVDVVLNNSPHKKDMSLKFHGTSASLSTDVNVRLSKTKGVKYAFQKNTNDDMIMFLDGFVGNIVETNSIIAKQNATYNGTIIDLYPPNYYTLTINSTISTTFSGNKVSFYSYCTNAGGLWEFILNEGTAREQIVQKSVYSSTAVYLEQVLFQNLDDMPHTLKGVFKGQDPANPVGAPRGWFYFGNKRPQDIERTFFVYGNSFDITKTSNALYSFSNKEYALEVRPEESTGSYVWLPEHNAVGTTFLIEPPRILIDGVNTSWSFQSFHNCETVQIIQNLKGVYPGDANNPLCEITLYTTIKNGHVNIDGKLKVLRPLRVRTGYSMMLPYWTSFAQKIITSLNNEYSVITNQTNLKEFIVEADECTSYAIINTTATDEKKDIVCALTITNIDKTMRYDETGRGEPFTFIEHRNASMGKLYLNQFKDVSLPTSYEYKFGGKYVVSIISGIRDLLK